MINAFAVKGKKTRPTVDSCELFISFRGKGLRGINATDSYSEYPLLCEVDLSAANL